MGLMWFFAGADLDDPTIGPREKWGSPAHPLI
jgi:hypothetical protein